MMLNAWKATSRVGIISAFALLGGTVSSEAAVLTFDDYTPVDTQPLASFDYGGLTFSFSDVGFGPGFFAGVWDGSSPNSNGTNSVIFGLGTEMTITRTGGGLFDLNSLDGVISWYSAATSAVMTINGGSPLAISNVLTTFITGLTGVSSLTFSGLSDGYWSVDNLDVNVSSVPVPAALPLLITGLGGLGWLARRRKQKVSLAS